ncbi:hypothetical protein ACS0TY_014487 [Phlomoides rotata]
MGESIKEFRPDLIQVQAQPVEKVRAKIDEDKEKGKSNESSKSNADKWKIPLLPKFRGIDERAEEFIAKFRQDMKLEREQSILEFEEMLKRSA